MAPRPGPVRPAPSTSCAPSLPRPSDRPQARPGPAPGQPPVYRTWCRSSASQRGAPAQPRNVPASLATNSVRSSRIGGQGSSRGPSRSAQGATAARRLRRLRRAPRSDGLLLVPSLRVGRRSTCQGSADQVADEGRVYACGGRRRRTSPPRRSTLAPRRGVSRGPATGRHRASRDVLREQATRPHRPGGVALARGGGHASLGFFLLRGQCSAARRCGSRRGFGHYRRETESPRPPGG